MKANIKLKQDGNYKIMTIEGEEEAIDYVTTVNIPTKVMKMNISLSCKLIAGFIFSFNFNNKKFFATNNFIANSLNISKHTVKESLSILEKNKVVFREYGKEKNKNDRAVYFNFNIMSQYEESKKSNNVLGTESVPTPVQKMYHTPSTESVPHILNTLTKQSIKQFITPVKTGAYDNFIKDFNEITGRNFTNRDKKARRQFEARLKEGYLVKDLLNATKACMLDDFHRESGFRYVQPEFITRSDKLEKYKDMFVEVPEAQVRSKSGIIF